MNLSDNNFFGPYQYNYRLGDSGTVYIGTAYGYGSAKKLYDVNVLHEGTIQYRTDCADIAEPTKYHRAVLDRFDVVAMAGSVEYKVELNCRHGRGLCHYCGPRALNVRVR